MVIFMPIAKLVIGIRSKATRVVRGFGGVPPNASLGEEYISQFSKKGRLQTNELGCVLGFCVLDEPQVRWA